MLLRASTLIFFVWRLISQDNIQNSTIVNRSSIQNAFNKLEASDKQTSEAFVKLADFIDKSGDPDAGTLFNGLSDELTKSTADKSRLKSLWSGIEKMLPTITTVAGTATKIVQLFS